MEYAGAIYHVLSRGDGKKAICRGDVDHQNILKTLGETRQKTGFEVHACCRMNNQLYRWCKANEAAP